MAGTVVLVPYQTHVEPACERGLRDLERAGLEVRRHASGAAIDRARCELATTALADGFDALLWIDSDVAFEAEAVTRLHDHALPLVAGVYAKKGAPELAVHLLPGTTELHVGSAGGLTEVRAVGAGFLLVRRDVLDDVQRHFGLPVVNTRFGQPLVPYFLPMVVPDPQGPPGSYWYLGEDYAFCERARQAGHRVMVDTTIRLGHVGKYSYGWEDAGAPVARVAGATFRFPGS